MLGKIIQITEVKNLKIAPVGKLNGENKSRLGMMSMLNALCGYGEMDGYFVETDEHKFHVLIDNGQCCCESWGYLQSEDDLSHYIGSNLLSVELTDDALNKSAVEKSDYYDDCGGIKFIDFITDQGTFQLAVYNGHNGYYGHGIVFAKDDGILLSDTL